MSPLCFMSLPDWCQVCIRHISYMVLKNYVKLFKALPSLWSQMLKCSQVPINSSSRYLSFTSCPNLFLPILLVSNATIYLLRAKLHPHYPCISHLSGQFSPIGSLEINSYFSFYKVLLRMKPMTI